MEGYTYPYPAAFSSRQPDAYPDHGDGFGDYYEMGPIRDDNTVKRSRSKLRTTKIDKRSRSRSRTSRSDRSRSRSLSGSRSLSRSRSHSATNRELKITEPSFLDAFRVLYLTPSKYKKSTTKYLSTKKHQDRVQEILKRDGLGSKRWLFYPRSQAGTVTITDEVPGARDNCDQRIKVDGHFFRKYKRSKKVDNNAPIAKLKRWELLFYKKLGFIQAV